MTTDKCRPLLISAGMFLLPLALVQAVSMLFGDAGPSEASAGPRPATAALTVPEPEDVEPARIAPGQEAAAMRAVALESQPFGPSPLYYAPRPARPEPIARDPEREPPPAFTVQAILAASSGNTALIDGRPHRVGDELGESGWYIVEIDSQSRSVTIRDSATERTETREVRSPG